MEWISLCVYLLILVFLIDYLWKPKHGNVLPYRIPIIGHSFLFLGDNLHNIHKVITDWSFKYPNTFTMQIFNKTVIVLNDYDSIHEALVTKGKDFGGRMTTFRLNYALQQLDILTPNIGQEWKKRRQLTHTYLKQAGDGMLHIQEIILCISQELVDCIQRRLQSENCFDPVNDIYLSITNTMSSLITGKKYHFEDTEFKNWYRLSKLANIHLISLNKGAELDLFPWVRHFGNETFTHVEEFDRLNKDLFNKMLSEYDSHSTTGEQKGLAHGLIWEMKNTSKGFLNEDNVRLIIMDIMIAGLITSSVSVGSFLQVMACYPDVQERMISEIKKTLNKCGSHRILLKHRDDMPYTKACMIELQRYLSAAPIGFPHVATTNTNLQDIPISKDTIVVTNLWKLHHDPTFWNNPWEFDPQRYLNDHGELVGSDHPNRKHTMPFGAGPRSCIGQSVAMSRLFIFATTLIQNFKVDIVNDEMKASNCRKMCDPINFDCGTALEPLKGILQFCGRENARCTDGA